MTAASDGVARDASDKTPCYEELRARILEARPSPGAAGSAVVLVRQGMSAWMQLDDSRALETHTQSDVTQHGPALRAPKRTELLAVLTNLVFNLCNQKESA